MNAVKTIDPVWIAVGVSLLLTGLTGTFWLMFMILGAAVYRLVETRCINKQL